MTCFIASAANRLAAHCRAWRIIINLGAALVLSFGCLTGAQAQRLIGEPRADNFLWNQATATQFAGSRGLLESGSANNKLTNQTFLLNRGFNLFLPPPSKLVYSSFDPGRGKKQIFSINSDGTGKTNLSNSSSYDDTDPVVSPDGSTIAFGRNWNLMLMDADGSNQRILTGAYIWYASQPSWSPDGSRIAFKIWNSRPDLYVINVDGTNLTRLTNSDAHEEWPIWSPDGSKIAFVRGNSLYNRQTGRNVGNVALDGKL